MDVLGISGNDKLWVDWEILGMELYGKDGFAAIYIYSHKIVVDI